MLGIVFTNPSAKVHAEDQDSTPTRLALERLRQERYAANLKQMATKLPEFKEAAKNKDLVAFLVKISSEQERNVLKLISGKLPSDAISYVTNELPPGIYIVGVLHPTSEDSFMRSKETKTYIVKIDQEKSSEAIERAELSELLRMNIFEQPAASDSDEHTK